MTQSWITIIQSIEQSCVSIEVINNRNLEVMNSLLCFNLWLYLWPYNLMTDSYSKLFLFNLSIKLFVLFSMKPPGFKLPFCWKYKVILRYGDPIDTGATVVKKFRRHSCWSHRDVVDGIPSWRHLLNISV